MVFPISRDPPEGGTPIIVRGCCGIGRLFPISRDPPEGGTFIYEGCGFVVGYVVSNF